MLSFFQVGGFPPMGWGNSSLRVLFGFVVQPELFHPVPEFIPREAQEPGRPSLVPPGQCQGLADEFPLDLLQNDTGLGEPKRRGR